MACDVSGTRCAAWQSDRRDEVCPRDSARGCRGLSRASADSYDEGLRNAGYLAAVIDADLSGTAAPEDAVEAAIAVFVVEKRKGLDVLFALRVALPEVQGRQAIIEEAHRFVPALQAKLAAAGLSPAAAAR